MRFSVRNNSRRQRQGNDGRTRLPPRFRPFSVRPPRVPAGRDGTHRKQPAPRQRPRQRPGNPAADGGINLRQRNPVAAAVTGNRPARPGDIADQRHGLNPGHDERHSPRRCITVLSPTAALQLTPGTSAARRRVKPWTQPAGSTAGRHLRQQPAGTDKTISPSAATQRNPETPKGKASASQGRQRQGNVGRARSPPRFRPFSVRPQRVPSGGTRFSPSPAGTTPGESLPVIPSPTVSPWTAEPGSRCSHREPPGKPWRHCRPAARTQPRPR